VGNRQQAARNAEPAQGSAAAARPRRAGGGATGAGQDRGGGVNIETVAFAFLAALLLVSALAVVLSTNLFHAVLWLALGLTGTAGIFLLLDAEFLAAVQILLYAGGVVTIVVFAIVVTERLVGERITQTNRRIFGGAVVSAGLLAVLLETLLRNPLQLTRQPIAVDVTRAIGEGVLTRFVLPFELLALLMLAGLLGAIYFARPDD
jgi:NADH:ubiquinone oxidoreductase subunit 6 (subunit J)